MQCPTHIKKLEEISSYTNQRCTICNAPSKFYCKSCEYTQCQECKVCTQKHQLIKIIDLVKIKPQYYNNAYACNNCSKSKTVDDDGIWHCNQCNYDLCLECVE